MNPVVNYHSNFYNSIIYKLKECWFLNFNNKIIWKTSCHLSNLCISSFKWVQFVGTTVLFKWGNSWLLHYLIRLWIFLQTRLRNNIFLIKLCLSAIDPISLSIAVGLLLGVETSNF